MKCGPDKKKQTQPMKKMDDWVIKENKNKEESTWKNGVNSCKMGTRVWGYGLVSSILCRVLWKIKSLKSLKTTTLFTLFNIIHPWSIL